MHKTASVGLLLASILFATAAHAGVSYAVPTGSSDSDGSLAGSVSFFLSGCDVSCVLNIEFTDGTSGSSMSVGQAMSGVNFDLSNTGTSVGAVSSAISDGSGNQVQTTAGPTSLTPASWQLSQTKGVYDFTTLTGGQPENLIAGSGTGSGTGPGFGSHSPTLLGTVLFQITGITGLNTETEISNVSIQFGTGPDKTIGETSSNCTVLSGNGDCGSGIITSGSGSQTPEPFSFFLAGGGLIALALMRRRVTSQN